MPDTFVALDVETANEDFASICSIGVVAFADGEVIDTGYTLVNPDDYFSAFNVSIHGITEHDVRDAPKFPEVADRLRQLLSDRIVVTHTAFDRAALRQVHAKHGLPEFSCRWLDSARVVRRAWPNEFARSGYGLHNVAEWCGIEFEHHHAAQDARAAGEILLRAVEATGLSVEDWLTRAQQGLDTDHFRREGVPDGPLHGERACFTGALTMSRREAADRAGAAGCEVVQTVSKKTTLLVVGQQDIQRLAGHTKSNKHRKAEELKAEGHSIRIIGEHDFLVLIGD